MLVHRRPLRQLLIRPHLSRPVRLGNTLTTNGRKAHLQLLVCRAKTLYDLLGVAPSATADEIHGAYRQLARKYHPDINKEHDAAAVFIQLKLAYETLGNINLRAEYDSAISAVAGRRVSRGKSKSWWNRSNNPAQRQRRPQDAAARPAPHGDDYVGDAGGRTQTAYASATAQAPRRDDYTAGRTGWANGYTSPSAPKRAWARTVVEEDPQEEANKKLRSQINSWSQQMERSLEEWTATLTMRSDWVDKLAHQLGGQVQVWVAEVAKQVEGYAATPPGPVRKAAQAKMVDLLSQRTRDVVAACQDSEQQLQWLLSEAQATASGLEAQLVGWEEQLAAQVAAYESSGLRASDATYRFQDEQTRWLLKARQRLAYWDTVVGTASREVAKHLSCWYLNRGHWLFLLELSEQQAAAVEAAEQLRRNDPSGPGAGPGLGQQSTMSTAPLGVDEWGVPAQAGTATLTRDGPVAHQTAGTAHETVWTTTVEPPVAEAAAPSAAPLAMREAQLVGLVLVPAMETRIVPVFNDTIDWVAVLARDEAEENGMQLSSGDDQTARQLSHEYNVRSMQSTDEGGEELERELAQTLAHSSSVALYAMLCYMAGTIVQRIGYKFERFI